MYKVLVAEDEMIERKVLCKTLNKYLGEVCTIYEASNGREAWDVYRQEKPQIVILDIQMPGATGLEVARRIREEGLPCVIVFLSAYDNFEYAREAIAVRATDYILKPYGEQELIATVEEAVRWYEWVAAQPGLRKPQPEKPEEAKDNENLRTNQVRDEIERYIQAHFTEDLSMQDVAHAMSYSEAYFCKLFKQCFKVNFSTYLNEYRISRAKSLLLSGTQSIRQISFSCGYTDSTYFSRVFRRLTGMTPSEYRTLQEQS